MHIICLQQVLFPESCHYAELEEHGPCILQLFLYYQRLRINSSQVMVRVHNESTLFFWLSICSKEPACIVGNSDYTVPTMHMCYDWMHIVPLPSATTAPFLRDRFLETSTFAASKHVETILGCLIEVRVTYGHRIVLADWVWNGKSRLTSPGWETVHYGR